MKNPLRLRFCIFSDFWQHLIYFIQAWFYFLLRKTVQTPVITLAELISSFELPENFVLLLDTSYLKIS